MRLALILALLPASTDALLPISAGRRAVLRETAAALAVAAAVPPAVAAADVGATQPMESVDVSAYQKIAGGGRYADLLVGKGTEVNAGSKVSLQWVLRRSNGYYVDGSIKMLSAQSGAVRVSDNFDEKDSFVFTVGDGAAMPGVNEGIKGMRQGGKRRLVLPVKQAYTLPIDRSPGPLPDGYGPRRQIERELQRQDPYNYFYLEVEATRVR